MRAECNREYSKARGTLFDHRRLSQEGHRDSCREGPRANRLKFTPDGKLVLISSLGVGDLTILDAATHKEVKRIGIGHGAAGIVMQCNGARAFVACSPENYVAVINLKSLGVVGHIDVGLEPDGLAWAVTR